MRRWFAWALPALAVLLGGCALIRDAISPPPPLEVRLNVVCEECTSPGIGEVPFTAYFWAEASDGLGLTNCSWRVARKGEPVENSPVESTSCVFFSYKFVEPGQYQVLLTSDQGEARTLVVALPEQRDDTVDVGASNEFVSCAQRIPGALKLGEKAILEVVCSVVSRTRLDYIHVQIKLGINDCLFSEDDGERVWYYVPPGGVVSTTMTVRGALEGMCYVETEVTAASGRSGGSLTLRTPVTVESP